MKNAKMLIFSVLFLAGTLYAQQEPTRVTDSATTTTVAVAEETSDDSATSLEVVVTGTRREEGIQETPVKTFVISSDEIQSDNAVSLADALEGETGVRVSATCQNCGAPEVRLIGLEGSYNQILINGMPVVDSLAGVYFLEQLPAELIDQIEIVKGGGSTLYGGSAVAGVINVVTKRPEENMLRLSTYFGGMESANGLTPVWKTGFVSTYVSPDGIFASSVTGSAMESGFYDRDGDGFSEIPNLKNESLSGDFFISPSEDDEIQINLMHIHEDRRGGDQMELPEHQTLIAESVDTYRNSVIVAWDHQLSLTSSFSLYASYVDQYRESYYGGGATNGTWTSDDTTSTMDIILGADAYGNTESPTFIAGGDFSFELFSKNELMIGVSYEYVKVDDFYPSLSSTLNATNTDLGIFVEDDWDLTEDLELIAGVRMDIHSDIESPIFSPRAAVKYSLSEPLALRLAYSTGFRAPGAFNEDFHISSVGGEPVVTTNASDLRPEYSQSVVLSLDYIDSDLYYGLSAYYVNLKDMFAVHHSTGADTRVNEGTGTVVGAEAYAGYEFESGLGFDIGFTYLYSDVEGEKILGTPDYFGNFSLDYNPEDLGFYAGIDGEILGSMLLEHVLEDESTVVETTEDIFSLDVQLGYEIGLNKFNTEKVLDISVGVENILDAYQPDFDTGEFRDPGYIYGPRNGRTYYVAISATF